MGFLGWSISILVVIKLVSNYRATGSILKSERMERASQQQGQNVVGTDGARYVVQQTSSFAMGMGIASVIIGVVAVFLCWVPVFGLLNLPVAILGGILGLIGLISGYGTSSIGMPKAGVVINLIPFLWQAFILS